MKKLVLSVVLLTWCCGLAWAGENDAVQNSVSVNPDEALVQEFLAWAESQGMITTVAKARVTHMPCPLVRECPTVCEGTTPCYKSGSGSTYDTGESTCQIGSHVIQCPRGTTIHVTTYPCSHCPCCFGPPPNCFCPNDCGDGQIWSCQ